MLNIIIKEIHSMSSSHTLDRKGPEPQKIFSLKSMHLANNTAESETHGALLLQMKNLLQKCCFSKPSKAPHDTNHLAQQIIPQCLYIIQAQLLFNILTQ